MIKKIVIIACFFLAPVMAMAHGFYMDIQGGGKPGDTVTIQIAYGEIDEYNVRQRETPEGPQFVLSVLFGNKVTVLPLTTKKDCWEATFVPHDNGVYRIIAQNDSLAVVDRSAKKGKNVRPLEYLCSTYTVGRGTEHFLPPSYPTIHLVQEGRLTRIYATNKNKPVPADTKIRIFNPDNWEKSLTTDENGSAVFYPAGPGAYIIRFDLEDTAPGTYEGVNYVATRLRCNYCLQIKKP